MPWPPFWTTRQAPALRCRAARTSDELPDSKDLCLPPGPFLGLVGFGGGGGGHGRGVWVSPRGGGGFAMEGRTRDNEER